MPIQNLASLALLTRTPHATHMHALTARMYRACMMAPTSDAGRVPTTYICYLFIIIRPDDMLRCLPKYDNIDASSDATR